MRVYFFAKLIVETQALNVVANYSPLRSLYGEPSPLGGDASPYDKLERFIWIFCFGLRLMATHLGWILVERKSRFWRE